MKRRNLYNSVLLLSNGKLVANFSSPHEFKFTDGSVLPAVSAEEANFLKVDFHETIHKNGDVELSFTLSDAVKAEMKEWEALFYEGAVDVVFCALPMITAMKEGGYDVKKSPFRGVRIEDRIAKLVSIDKQCI